LDPRPSGCEPDDLPLLHPAIVYLVYLSKALEVREADRNPTERRKAGHRAIAAQQIRRDNQIFRERTARNDV
jgi:hypothetical protein